VPPQLQTIIASKGLRDSLTMIFGNAGAVTMSALAIILISRLLGPASFGEFSVGFALVLLLSRVNDLGLTNAVQQYIPRAKNNEEKARIFSYTIKIKLITSLVLFVIGLLITPFLAEWLNFSRPSILYGAFAANIATVLYEHLAAMLQSLHNIKGTVTINALQAGTKLIGALVFFLISYTNPVPVYYWYMAGPIVPVILASLFLPKWFTLKLKDDYKAESKLLKAMASHAAIGFIAAGIIENVDILFVQGYLNTYETGLYSGASRIAMMLSLAAYSLASVLNPRVARYTEAEHLQRYLKKAMLLIVFSLLGFVLSIPLIEPLILFTIGPEYLAAGNILMILLAASFLTFASVPLIALFFSFKKAEWYFSASGLIQLAIILSGSILLVPTHGLAAAAWTRLASKVALFTFTALMAAYFYRRKKLQTGQS